MKRGRISGLSGRIRGGGDTALFLLSVLLAFTVWFIHNLSQDYTDLVTVNVRASSNIEGRAALSSEAVSVAARCRATGFRHISLATRRREVTVTMVGSDFRHRDGDYYFIDAAALGKYAEEIFGNRVRVESFVSQGVSFRFQEENYRKVPVQAVRLLSYRPQYMASGPMVLSPDSVVVYGDPRILAGVERVFTRQISLSDIHGSLHGIARLEVPGGMRLSSKEVEYSMEVSRFVEVRSRVSVVVRNVPAGRKLSVLPSSAEVVYRCIFPMIQNPEGRTEFYVDYTDFAESRSGKCLVRHDALPQGVIEAVVTPEVFECIETL